MEQESAENGGENARSNKRRWLSAAGIALIAGGLWLAVTGLPPFPWWQQQFGRFPYAEDKSAIDQGRRLYTTWCSGCHGEGYVSVLRRHSGHMWLKPDLYEIITDGRPATGMPALGDKLSARERWKIISYIVSDSRKRR